ncbi:uncharacterized protein C20orf96 [Chanos chanos]|uniref:Uncharacterized protein C20orf96 n=1 Tax=Chanos chanos TaxID=29144 RepID=A0A6J2VSJ6_CHACN|nr:uncharacterized protein C20orf96 homolog [Chanos chanos]
MNGLPDYVAHSLREDFKTSDYSEWERHRRSKVSKQTKREPVPWASAPPYRRVDPNSSCEPTTEQEDTVLIKSGRQNVEDLKKRCAFLQEMNLLLAREIQEIDRTSASESRKCLIQHEKLGSSFTAFNRWNSYEISQAEAELKDKAETAEREIDGLRKQLRYLKLELSNAQAELHTLKTYKDKEYPVKALKIADMKREVDKLKQTQQDECEEVNLVCQREMVNLEKHFEEKQREVLSAIAKQSLSGIPPFVKRTASHNHTMKREIEMHKKEIKELEERNRVLYREVQELKLLRTNIQKEIFQDVFPKADKCTPDMDITLSIPQREWLPI